MTNTKLLLMMLLWVTMLIGGAKDSQAEWLTHDEWIEVVQKLRKEGKNVEIIKSDNLVPEKSPAEFWENFRKEMVKEGFDQRLFIQKVSRGLMVENRVEESGIPVFSKQNINPNYRIVDDKGGSRYSRLIVLFNTDRFCIDPYLLNGICDKVGKCKQYWHGVTYFLGREEIYFQYDGSKSKCIEKLIFNLNSQVKY